MCRVIKNYLVPFVGWFLVLILHGCFLHSSIGPGYAVDIKVTESGTRTIKDIKFLEDVAKTEGFGGKRVSSYDKWECIHFIKDTPQIQVGFCYDIEQNLTHAVQGVRNLRLLVSNDWQGQKPALKQEIDRVGEVFYKELSARFGKENVKMERRRTGPPF